MRSLAILAIALALLLSVVSASPAPAVVLNSGSSNDIVMKPRGGSPGFQDYVIPAGPTGVDLAGALNEIPGYGVGCFPRYTACLSILS